MRKLLVIAILLSMYACKNDKQSPAQDATQDELENSEVILDSIRVEKSDADIEKQNSIVIKQKALEEKEDESTELFELVLPKEYIKEEPYYSINFRFPLLNEEIKASYSSFNEYMTDYYVNISEVEAGLIEAQEACDTIPLDMKREERKINYKIYNVNDQVISMVFYKENFYAWTLHPTYTFDCMNYDLERSTFMTYEDFFNEGSEEELREILNEVLMGKINSGEMYYDCWGITSEDFFKYKNNFVLEDDSVEYYFDDCVVCPSYTGSYSVENPPGKIIASTEALRSQSFQIVKALIK